MTPSRAPYRRAVWVLLYAVAMALVEAAVVVYLRALGPAAGPLAALHTYLPGRILAIEVYREAATIFMLLSVAVLAGRNASRRFLYFCFAFGVWDAFYYVWLRVFMGWPASLLDWDVLFLIPVPWVAPVLAPVIVSVCLIAGSLWLLERPLPGVRGWVSACSGAALILLSFTLDAHAALTQASPPPFRWVLFGAGVALGLLALAIPPRLSVVP